jgi:hypothetical protein
MTISDSEYISPTFRSEVDREMEMLFGRANHATNAMLVPSVCFGMPSLGDRIFHRLMNTIAERWHSRDGEPWCWCGAKGCKLDMLTLYATTTLMCDRWRKLQKLCTWPKRIHLYPRHRRPIPAWRQRFASGPARGTLRGAVLVLHAKVFQHISGVHMVSGN